jgi:hypothetical protein
MADIVNAGVILLVAGFGLVAVIGGADQLRNHAGSAAVPPADADLASTAPSEDHRDAGLSVLEDQRLADDHADDHGDKHGKEKRGHGHGHHDGDKDRNDEDEAKENEEEREEDDGDEDDD